MTVHKRLMERMAAEYLRLYRTEGLDEATRYAERVVKHKKEHYDQLRVAVKEHIRSKG